jgi:hypothetical protein
VTLKKILPSIFLSILSIVWALASTSCLSLSWSNPEDLPS